MRPSFRLQIITPQGIVYKGDVVHSLIPSENGFVGVLAHHAPYVTSSSGGAVRLNEKDEAEKKFTVGPGFFTVSENDAYLLTRTCEEIPPPA